MNSILPLFQYPTTVVWLDDDELFLETIKLTIKDSSKHKMFTQPQACEAYFANLKNPISKTIFLHGEHDHENYDLLEHAPVDFDVTKIANLFNHPERHDEPSILVCDYNLPQTNGLEICKKLGKQQSLKKILLTGQAENQDAVTAFNNGLIDRFLRKDSQNLLNEVKGFLKVLMRQYFCDITKPLLSHLEADAVIPLSDPAFIVFFDNWCESNKIQEFYLIDKQGSFLAIDQAGKQHYFVTHTDKSLDKLINIYADNAASKALLQEVVQRTKIPFFGYGKQAWQFETNSWQQCFYSPNVFMGREKYYWVALNNF